MDKAKRLEIIQDVWGPPPTDPVLWSTWDNGNHLMAELPDLVRGIVAQEVSDHPSLLITFDTILPRVEAEVVWQYLSKRKEEDIRSVVRFVLYSNPWCSVITGMNPLQRLRITDRLADDVSNNLGRIIHTDPRFRAWLLGW